MQDDLFAEDRRRRLHAAAPLADRMRPRTLGEVVGQAHLLSPGAAFRTVVEEGRPVSMILWGPPGTGKTTLARILAEDSGSHFAPLSATSSGVKDVREVLAGAERRLGEEGRRTVLFLDEIHRFSKSQQDALLPGVERGIVTLVGATTENPFFEVNSPLISRSTLFRLEPLASEEVGTVIDRALADPERGLGTMGLRIEPEARWALAERVGGDARLALNALEVAALLARDGVIGLPQVEEALQRRIVRYDKAGDRHYDVISAFIKSMRGSDPDAALYWLHTMLAAGEDPEFIARRMVIFASEDVGLADWRALQVAVAAAEAVRFVGLPEAAFNLSHAAAYLATAPKSDTIKRAMGEAARAVEEAPGAQVPLHLRSGSYPGAASLGHGTGYENPHRHPDHLVRQEHLPEEARGRVVFRPSRQGEEAEIAERLAEWDRQLGRPDRRQD